MATQSTSNDADALEMRVDFAEKAKSLRELRSATPTPAARDEVTLALGSKFEGIQAVAAEVLGAWGDPDSIKALLDWLDGLPEGF